MPNFTIKQGGLFYCYTTPVEQMRKIDTFLSLLEESGIAEILKNVEKQAGLGRPSFDPYAMFATIVYGFSVGSPTLRELEDSCLYDIRFKYLMNDETPDYSSFSRFINAYIKPNADLIFSLITKVYLKYCRLCVDECHIDGTKFEAKPNKYKVVWKPTTYHAKLSDKVRSLLSELQLTKDVPTEGVIPSSIIASKLKQASDLAESHLDDRKVWDRKLKELTKYLSKSLEYEEKNRICGPDRNSYYKTDHDATAMCLKEDYYSGLGSNLHAAYQVQTVVSNGFIVAYYISQDRVDTHTFIPTLERFNQAFGKYPKSITADSGYGCLENYQFCDEKGIEAYIKYQAWRGECSGRRPALYELNENNTITCLAGRTGFEVQIPGRHHKQKESVFFEVKCMNRCPFKSYCRRFFKVKTGRTRVFDVHIRYRRYIQKARDLLLSPKGIEMRVNRSCQVEGVYGITKWDMGYNRIRRVGINRISTEIMLTYLGLNTRKLFKYLDGKDPFTYWKAPKDLQAETFKKPSAKRIANRMATWKKRVKQPNEIAKASYRRKRKK